MKSKKERKTLPCRAKKGEGKRGKSFSDGRGEKKRKKVGLASTERKGGGSLNTGKENHITPS